MHKLWINKKQTCDLNIEKAAELSAALQPLFSGMRLSHSSFLIRLERCRLSKANVYYRADELKKNGKGKNKRTTY